MTCRDLCTSIVNAVLDNEASVAKKVDHEVKVRRNVLELRVELGLAGA